LVIHGRNDLGGTLTSWELARAGPGAELIIIEDSGHTGSPAMTDHMHAAVDRLYQHITTRGWPQAKRRRRHEKCTVSGQLANGRLLT
jgi:hypothetical protein